MNLDIAHIEALHPGGPRYRDEMTDRERNAFWNLLLMCRPHHRHIDEDEEKFGVPVLRGWKRQAESDIDKRELEIFRGLTEEKFEEVISGVIHQHAVEMKTALDELRDLSQEHKGLLRAVLDRIDDSQLAGGYFDANQVSQLNDAAASLSRILRADNLDLFYEGTRIVERNFDQAIVGHFYDAVRQLDILPGVLEKISALEQVVHSPALAHLPDTVAHLQRVVDRMPRGY